jgi:hypothetical protein
LPPPASPIATSGNALPTRGQALSRVGYSAILAVVDRAELVQIQQFCQLVGVDAVTFVSIFEVARSCADCTPQPGDVRLWPRLSFPGWIP